MATPRILRCADIGQRPASDRIAPAFVRIPAPLVLKRRPPSPAACRVSAIRSARSPRECGCRPLSWSRCYVSPCTQRRSVERGMPYSALICDDGLPFPLRLHDLPLELLLVMTGTIRIGHDDQLLRCHVPHEPVRYIVANPVVAHMEDIHTLTRPTFY